MVVYGSVLTALVADVVVTFGVSRCSFAHRWNRWREYTNTVVTKHVDINVWTGSRTYIGESTNVEYWQARQCSRCGIAQRRQESRGSR